MSPRRLVNQSAFNQDARFPFELRSLDFQSAMQDVYDFFFDVNEHLAGKGLPRLEDTLRKANLSGTLSDMLTAALAKHSRTLVQNRYHNGHPDLILRGVFPNDSVKAGEQGVEIKSTVRPGGAVDTHGGRNQWMCVFVYRVDQLTEPAVERRPLKFTEVYLGWVTTEQFRNNPRGRLGTRTSTLGREAIAVLREQWVYLDVKAEC
ncbi:MAG: hypothetical protein ACRDZ5_03835 [Acidimicrobiales bacterium]